MIENLIWWFENSETDLKLARFPENFEAFNQYFLDKQTVDSNVQPIEVNPTTYDDDSASIPSRSDDDDYYDDDSDSYSDSDEDDDSNKNYDNVEEEIIENNNEFQISDAEVFDVIAYDNIKISDHLKTDANNLCFAYENESSILTYYLSNRDDILKLFRDGNIIKYPCREIDTNGFVPRIENVEIETPIFPLSSIGILLGGYVKLSQIKYLLSNEGLTRIKLTYDNIEYPTVTSIQMLTRDRNAVSAAHCQKGHSGKLYKLENIEKELVDEDGPIVSTEVAVKTEKTKDEIDKIKNEAQKKLTKNNNPREEWVVKYDKKKQKAFYKNYKLNVVQWIPPPNIEVSEDKIKNEAQKKLTKNNNPREEWVVKYDKKKQRAFYKNYKLNVVQWDPPPIVSKPTRKTKRSAQPAGGSGLLTRNKKRILKLGKRSKKQSKVTKKRKTLKNKKR